MTLTDVRAIWDTKASQRSGSEQIWQLRLLKDATTTGYNFTDGPDIVASNAEGNLFQTYVKGAQHSCCVNGNIVAICPARI